MKFAIEHRKDSFTERFSEVCQRRNIEYKLVDSRDSNMIEQLSDCDVFLWCWYQTDPDKILFARQLTYSLEQCGKLVFPNAKTVWHFDDKVGQKYLFEALRLPTVPSYVFYDRQKALRWTTQTDFPKVFKLRGGAGSTNVQLVRSARDGKKLINKMFSSGMLPRNNWAAFIDQFHKWHHGRSSLRSVLSTFRKFVQGDNYTRITAKERGYIYFQDFIPDNRSDIRVIVIGNKAFSIRRMCRENDFRASGSGFIHFAKEEQNEECVEIAFFAAAKMQSQCVAFDFVFTSDNKPLIVECSYGFSMRAYDSCPGYWDKQMKWHEGQFNPQEWIVEDIIAQVNKH